MAEVSLALGKYHEAIAKYKKSVDLDPNNAVVYNNWGSALEKLGLNSEEKRKFSPYRELFRETRRNQLVRFCWQHGNQASERA